MAIKVKSKNLGFKHVMITILTIIGIVLIVWYAWEWYKVKTAQKYYSSYLMETNTIIYEMDNINEIATVLSETPNYYFVYISYAQDKEVNNLEKDLKPLIDEYNIANCFYFINVTNIRKNNKNYIQDIAKELDIDKDKIEKVPAILYFKDGELINTVYSVKEFKDLLKNNNDSM